jgi:2-methylaconitate cis-trans-isomerase PrpF
MTVIASPADYTTATNQNISADRFDLLGRMMSMQKAHPTYAMTGAMCTAAAAVIPGTLVYELKRSDADPRRLRIAHPEGILEAGVEYEEAGGRMVIKSAYGFRTTRLLMKGTAYY